jgi:Trk K+ transport system NAD-binding subunit
VAGRLLAHHLLGEEYIDLERGLKLARVAPSRLLGKSPLEAPELAGRACQIVAVERGTEVVIEFPQDFRIQEGDLVYLAGSPERLDAFISASTD